MPDVEAPSNPAESRGPRRRRRRRRRNRTPRFDWHKALFVLPNLFTLSGMFCGFYAIILCLDHPGPTELYRAALSVFFGIFFDMFDGRVARMTRTQSEFGIQLDSLADMISFGIAPAVILYRWSLSDLGAVGLVVSFVYAGCGASRLARFNVLASKQAGSSKYFLGLPIPLAAGTIVSLVMATYPHPAAPFGTAGALAVALVLGALMVSSVHYRSFKDFRPSRKSVTLVFIAVLLGALITTHWTALRPPTAIAILFVGYITAGLVEEVLFFRRRRDPDAVPPPDRRPA